MRANGARRSSTLDGQDMARNHFLHVLIAGGIIGQIGLLVGCDLPEPDDNSFNEAIGLLAEEDGHALDELQSEDQAAALETERDLSAIPARPSTAPAYAVD